MKYLTSSQIRQMWLDFFKSKGHNVEASASLVPQNDPTLLWTNAGVTPLKKYFDGTMVPLNPRITNAQKCIRTNDIENVGKTARHHTFFEMLGNFSIGDYFKKEAIEFACELLFDVKWFGFAKEKLYITYYYHDQETKELWMKHGVSEDHLIPLEGNFWEIGEGPCGPDTEMFYDRGEKYDKRGKELIVQDIENDRFIEIWNIVFSQFNSKTGVPRDEYKELPSKNIDTGCGLERLCCVMQGVDSNYDTDLFRPIITKTEEISGVKYEGQMAFKVIADHVRTVTFAVADGATLSNEGRGYVLRRVLRRATKYAKTLGITKPFMASLVDVVIEIMNSYYPYLEEKANIVKQIITNEEKKFLETLNQGEKRLSELLQNTTTLSGKDAFVLYDTYGFPFELTKEYALEKGVTVDEDGFKAEMEAQRQRARNSRKEVTSMGGQNEEFLNFKLESEFVGYDTLETKSKVIAVFDNGIVLDKTPFYATSGGQLCDKGLIDGINVLNVIKMPNGQFLHLLEENPFKVNDEVNALVDKNNRLATMRNHSAAHLLQKALQVVLGEHVHQQGQQVNANSVRFDFNNYNNVTEEEIIKIENLVNQYINEAHEVIVKVMPIEEAKSLGAMALFGEKYGDNVRVVNMNVSKEFCGGTHVENTKDIIKFRIISSESIGSGIFRITASTGLNADETLEATLENTFSDIYLLENKAQKLIKENNSDLENNVRFVKPTSVGYQFVLDLRAEYQDLSSKLHTLEKTINDLNKSNTLKNLSSFESKIENNTIVSRIENCDKSLLKDIAKTLQNNYNLDLVLLAYVEKESITFVCATSKKYNACNFVKLATSVTKGGGGGKPDLAQAGGKDVTKVDEALALVKENL